MSDFISFDNLTNHMASSQSYYLLVIWCKKQVGNSSLQKIKLMFWTKKIESPLFLDQEARAAGLHGWPIEYSTEPTDIHIS